MTPLEIDSLHGTELAGYRIESLLGRGGMGVVYLADDLRLGRKVALKLVAPGLATDARFRERFLRESRLAASLDHSHVVPVYAAGETDGQLWIAMRHVQGTDLRTLLEQAGPLEPARALGLVAQVGSALDTAHAHGLVHRDVKPANVLVTEEDGAEHCYLTDFGLARSPDAAADPGAGPHLSGTVDYTAPEQIAREPADHRADVYSLACVLYECLAGQPPFRRDRPAATLFAHVQEEPPRLTAARPELPRSLDQVLATALAKAPEDRHATCAQLVADARSALGLDERRFSRRTLLLAGGGAALAATAAAVVPAILLSRRSEPASPPKPPPALSADGVLRIDPATLQPVAAIPTDIRADTLAIGDGAVWVLDTGTGELVSIGVASNRVDRRISPEQPTRVTTVAAGEGAVWLQGDTVEPSLWRVDVEAGAYLPYPPAPAGGFQGVTIGLGSVWAINLLDREPGALLRFDPGTGTLLDYVEDEAWDYRSFIMSAVGGLVWAVARGTKLTNLAIHAAIAFDPQAGAIVHEYSIGFRIGDFAVGEDAVWVTGPDTDTVARLDPVTGRVTQEVRVGRVPEQLAVGAGAVWATSGRDGTVTRVDPATLDIETIDVGGIPTDIAADADSVWVAVDVR